MQEVVSDLQIPRPRRRRQSPTERWLRRGAVLLVLSGGCAVLLFQLSHTLQNLGLFTGTTAAPLDLQVLPEAIVDSQYLPRPELARGEQLVALEAAMHKLTQQPRLRSGFLFFDPVTGAYAQMAADESFSAASVIKVPVLVELMRQVDGGSVRLDEVLTLKAAHKGGGSGWLQYRPNGTRMSVLAVATLMIIRSDNTATNMIIDRLGGAAYLNEQFRRWGLRRTVINAPLPDLEGTNTTSPGDLALLMSELDRGELTSPQGRTVAYGLMGRTRIGSLLPMGLGPGARILHKTGDIGKMVGDVGVVTTPDGRRYLATALVERPHNDRRANQLIAKLSQAFYHVFANTHRLGTVPRKT